MSWARSAGPNCRAGLADPPLRGPNVAMMTAVASPTAQGSSLRLGRVCQEHGEHHGQQDEDSGLRSEDRGGVPCRVGVDGRIADGAAGDCRSPDKSAERRSRDGTGQLGRDVRDDGAGREGAEPPQRDGDGGVEVSAGPCGRVGTS